MLRPALCAAPPSPWPIAAAHRRPTSPPSTGQSEVCAPLATSPRAGATHNMASADVAAPSNKLYVGNLSWSMRDEDLQSAFAAYGPTESRVVFDRETGRSRGFGFVTFSDEPAATAALTALNGTELSGRTIRISYASSGGGGGGGGGGYRGGGGGGGGGGFRGGECAVCAQHRAHDHRHTRAPRLRAVSRHRPKQTPSAAHPAALRRSAAVARAAVTVTAATAVRGCHAPAGAGVCARAPAPYPAAAVRSLRSLVCTRLRRCGGAACAGDAATARLRHMAPPHPFLAALRSPRCVPHAQAVTVVATVMVAAVAAIARAAAVATAAAATVVAVATTQLAAVPTAQTHHNDRDRQAHRPRQRVRQHGQDDVIQLVHRMEAEGAWMRGRGDRGDPTT